MLIIFFDIKGIVHEEFALEGQPVNWLKVITSAVPCNNFLIMFIHVYFFLPLHVSALVGHLQAEYTNISGSYFTYNGSIVPCALYY
jgi:hypothetical protein